MRLLGMGIFVHRDRSKLKRIHHDRLVTQSGGREEMTVLCCRIKMTMEFQDCFGSRIYCVQCECGEKITFLNVYCEEILEFYQIAQFAYFVSSLIIMFQNYLSSQDSTKEPFDKMSVL
jgi:hypothetical protein